MRSAPSAEALWERALAALSAVCVSALLRARVAYHKCSLQIRAEQHRVPATCCMVRRVGAYMPMCVAALRSIAQTCGSQVRATQGASATPDRYERLGACPGGRWR